MVVGPEIGSPIVDSGGFSIFDCGSESGSGSISLFGAGLDSSLIISLIVAGALMGDGRSTAGAAPGSGAGWSGPTGVSFRLVGSLLVGVGGPATGFSGGGSAGLASSASSSGAMNHNSRA